MISRRTFLFSSTAAVGGALVAAKLGFAQEGVPEIFEVMHTEEEWRALLTPEQFYILREQGTEFPFTSELLDEHRAGTFNCAGCDLPLYASETKYDSRTGWPSFWEAMPDATRTSPDFELLVERTEEHCRRCGGHMGHVFDDGPPPTGKRHCINGDALVFVAA